MCTGCEATEGNDPLLCACGKHSAKYAAGKGKEARPKWLVYSSARPSEKPKLVTTRSQKAGALQAVTELCKGHFSKRSAPAPAAQPAQLSGRPVAAGRSTTTIQLGKHLDLQAQVEVLSVLWMFPLWGRLSTC